MGEGHAQQYPRNKKARGVVVFVGEARITKREATRLAKLEDVESYYWLRRRMGANQSQGVCDNADSLLLAALFHVIRLREHAFCVPLTDCWRREHLFVLSTATALWLLVLCAKNCIRSRNV